MNADQDKAQRVRFAETATALGAGGKEVAFLAKLGSGPINSLVRTRGDHVSALKRYPFGWAVPGASMVESNPYC